MLPAKRKSKTRQRTQRAHHALKGTNLVSCPRCSKAKLPHCACSSCGYVSTRTTLPMAEEKGE